MLVFHLSSRCLSASYIWRRIWFEAFVYHSSSICLHLHHNQASSIEDPSPIPISIFHLSSRIPIAWFFLLLWLPYQIPVVYTPFNANTISMKDQTYHPSIDQFNIPSYTKIISQISPHSLHAYNYSSFPLSQQAYSTTRINHRIFNPCNCTSSVIPSQFCRMKTNHCRYFE